MHDRAEQPFVDPGAAADRASGLRREYGMSFTVADALDRNGRGAGEETARWLEPKLAHLTVPDAMLDRAAAADRIAFAIRKHEPIVVFGDYDCDGITATAIVTEVVRALGGQATPMVASRFAGGYGFSEPALERVLAAEPKLIVTCDCGSSDHERIATAASRGVDTVVIDHHLVPEQALPAVAFLNPHRPECGFAYKGLASCGLALVLAAALRKQLDRKLDLRSWLDLVAVGTVADVAPLDGDNRVLVRKGLQVLNAGHRIGLAALALKSTRGRRLPAGSEDIAFQIAPRLNAPGRLGDPQVALDILLERDAHKVATMADQIEQQTVQRRAIQAKMLEEAVAEIAECNYADDPAIVLARPDWHPGVVGIVAGRLAAQFGKPTVVIALEAETGRGSARAPDGFRLYDSLAVCRQHLAGFGGHQAAAGLEVQSEKLEQFRSVWSTACAEQLKHRPIELGSPQPDVRLDSRDDLGQVLSDLEQLEPCGKGNPAPKLLMTEVTIRTAKPVKTHLKLDLTWRGQQIRGFAPNRGGDAPRLSGRTVELVGRMKRDHWRGGQIPEILVEAYRLK